MPYLDREDSDAADAASNTSDTFYCISFKGLLNIALTLRKLCGMMKGWIDRETAKGDSRSVMQLLVLLQLTNYCILISALLERRVGADGKQ